MTDEPKEDISGGFLGERSFLTLLREVWKGTLDGPHSGRDGLSGTGFTLYVCQRFENTVCHLCGTASPEKGKRAVECRVTYLCVSLDSLGWGRKIF